MTTDGSSRAFALDIGRLSFTYPDGQVALQEIDLCVMPGEKIALVGPNGAGKSTLLLHLSGILRGTGRLVIMSLPLTDANLPLIRARVGLVFQAPDDQLFSPTVYEDVAFGPLYQGRTKADVERHVHTALEAVGMVGYGNRFSHHLSLGEKKRIAIASVLSMEPDILALDEPTAGLDPRARRGLIRLLENLPQTMIIATHDMRLVHDLLPRTVVMDEGRIVADGPTSALLADQALLAAHGLE